MSNPFDDPDLRSAFGAAGMVHQPGLANDLLQEMAPLLAEDGIDINDPSTFDMATLNTALARAVERTNLERFTPIGVTRSNALSVLRSTSEAISANKMQDAQATILSIAPEPKQPGEPSVAHLIGASLGLLDSWHRDPSLTPLLVRTRVPRWASRSRAAGTDIVALARKGRAFESIAALHGRYDGLTILEGSILAVAGTLQTWADATGQSVHDLGVAVLTE